MKYEQLRKTAAELNDVMGLNPPISPVLDTDSVIETIKKILRLNLINAADVFTPETDALLQEIRDTPDDGLSVVTAPEEGQPEEPEGGLFEIVRSAMKLRELKDVVHANIEFKEIRPDLDTYKNVEILRDKLFEILTEKTMTEGPGIPIDQPPIVETMVLEHDSGVATAEGTLQAAEQVPEEDPEILTTRGELFINPNFEAACPKLSEAEYASLEDLILRDGKILQPILVWNETIVDGHNRSAIAKKWGLPFTVETMEFDQERDAILWIKENALSQRNLSDYAKYEMIKSIEKDLKAIGVKNKGYKAMLAEVTPHNTREELADLTGMSASQIAKAKQLDENASEETKEQLRSGKIKIGTAHKKLKKDQLALTDTDDMIKAGRELDKWIKKHAKNDLLREVLQEARGIVGKISNMIAF